MSAKDTAPLCSDPRADRQERETLVARALARGWAETPATQELIAAQLHTRPARVRAWLDTHSGESVPVAMLLGLPPVVARPVIALLAESLGCALAELPDAQAVEGARLRVVSSAAKETGEAVAKLVAAAASETLTDGEADAIERELSDAIAALVAGAESVRTRRRKVTRIGGAA